MANKLGALLARRAQASRAKRGKSPQGTDMNPPTAPVSFTSLEDRIVPDGTAPTVREIILQSARHDPPAVLQALKQCEATPVEQRTPLGINHQLNIGIPASLFLSMADDIRAAAREALGL